MQLRKEKVHEFIHRYTNAVPHTFRATFVHRHNLVHAIGNCECESGIEWKIRKYAIKSISYSISK